jgi:3-deoxy-manno-octulosonate cytidylyltransferase (CMP-KDO synthetase)
LTDDDHQVQCRPPIRGGEEARGSETASRGEAVDVLAIIPARYASERLPGKPLLRETGRTLLEHAWRRVREARGVGAVRVATDDARIADAVRAFGGEAVMTSAGCRTGTDRVAEAAAGCDAGLVLNVQGDEPEIPPAALEALIGRMARDDAPMGTLACPLDDPAAFADPNKVKVVTDGRGRALYFSRAPIPHRRGGADGAAPAGALLHIGVYAYRPAFLQTFAGLPSTPLERAERLEQLRALEHGHAIAVAVFDGPPWGGVDTREDYEAFVRRWRASMT